MTEELKQDAAPAGESPATPQDELTKCRAQAEEYLAGWKRAAADYANLQKDMSRRVEENAKYASCDLVMALLPALDGFREAITHVPEVSKDGHYDVSAVMKWTEGISNVKSAIEQTMKNQGVSHIDEEDVPFDPAIHEAVLLEKQEGVEPGMVLRVVQAGCRMHGRVLRPAKVVVSQ